MTPLVPTRPPSRAAGQARFVAVALSLAIHGAAAAAFLFAVDDERPAPGGTISVELVSALPGGSGGPHETADKPTSKAEPAQTAEAATPAETANTKPAPETLEAPIKPAADEPRETVAKPKPKAEPEAVRKLEEAARPKLATKPAPRVAPARKAEPDAARDAGTAGPAGSAADGPQIAAIERTAPGFAVGSGANPLPDYPYRARRAGHQGRVVLKVAVGADGVPVAVTVERSSGHDSLDDAALDTVRRWRFAPATVGGVAVAGTVEVPITFRLVNDTAR
jgi:protein TonB